MKMKVTMFLDVEDDVSPEEIEDELSLAVDEMTFYSLAEIEVAPE